MSAQKVAIVTGGNKGIGFAIVRALCKKFDGVVYLTARDEGRGKEAIKQLESEGLNPKFHQLDVTSKHGIDVLKDYLMKNYGGVDVFVHNAGILFKNEDATPFAEQASVTVHTNFDSTVYIGNAFLPVIKTNGRLAIVSSTGGVFSLGNCSPENQAFFKSADLTEEKLIHKLKEFVDAAQTNAHITKGFSNNAYGMSKLGINAFTRILGRRARQLEQSGVLVNCCCPGYVHTDMTSHKGNKTPDQGAETPVFIALLPRGAVEPNGEFLSEKKVYQWYR